MKTLASAVLGAFLTLFSASTPQLDPIQPLQWTHTYEDGTTALVTGCTTWATEASDHRLRWITAAHCVLNQWDNIAQRDFQTANAPMRVVKVDRAHDLAALVGPDAPALVLARHMYSPETIRRGNARVITSGFPYGWSFTTSTGTVANPDMQDPNVDVTRHFQVWAMAGAPGASGSPLFDQHHHVLSVVQMLFFGGYLGGCQLEELRAFVESL